MATKWAHRFLAGQCLLKWGWEGMRVKVALSWASSSMCGLAARKHERRNSW